MRRVTPSVAALVLGALSLATAAWSGPPIEELVSDGTGPLDTASDLRDALAAEQRLLDHLHYGQIHEQHYQTPERVAGQISRLVGENDSALYTGNYLGAQAFRYTLAKAELAKLPGPGDPRRIFWEGQLGDAKERVDAMVQQFHKLINLSASWQTTFDPRINEDREPTDDGYIDFGGGVFPAERGLLFRACNPVDAPAPLNVGRDPSRDRLVGPLNWEDGRQYYCLDATSRDAYAGTTFGLVTALDLVGPDDPELRSTVAADLMAMTDYAFKYLWWQPRPHGEVVIPEVFGGNDLDNFVSPLFVHTPMAQLNMAQVARHAARVAGTPEQQQRFEAIWAEALATTGPFLAASMEIDAAAPHDSYYKFHLNHLTGFNLIRLEPDPTVRDLFRQAFGVMDATTGDDVNALFEAMTFALTGEKRRLNAAAVHHRQWLEYVVNYESKGFSVRNSNSCGRTRECVPEDQIDVVQKLPLVGEVVVPILGTSPTLRSRLPLPVRLRRPADFMWQKDPTALDGSQPPTWEPPGADFLLPYWMIRYYSEAARPPVRAFPAWSGPVYR